MMAEQSAPSAPAAPIAPAVPTAPTAPTAPAAPVAPIISAAPPGPALEPIGAEVDGNVDPELEGAESDSALGDEV